MAEGPDPNPIQHIWSAVSHLRTEPYGVTGTGKDVREIADDLEAAAYELRDLLAKLDQDTPGEPSGDVEERYGEMVRAGTKVLRDKVRGWAYLLHDSDQQPGVVREILAAAGVPDLLRTAQPGDEVRELVEAVKDFRVAVAHPSIERADVERRLDAALAPFTKPTDEGAGDD